MIATDLDSTLLRGDKSVSAYTAEVLAQCRARGIKVVAATGRSRPALMHVIDPDIFDAQVVNNGALTYIGDEIVRECTLPLELSREILLELAQNPAVTAISARYRDQCYRSTMAHFSDIVHDFTQPLEVNVTRASFTTQDHEFGVDLVRRYPQLRICRFSGEDVYDIGPATKAQAIEALAAHWGIAMRDVIAFGDDFNDVDMLRACGTGVAVANAIDKAKAAADHICASNEDDGVVKWIGEHIFT
jgi:hypothetical protein